MEGQGIRNNTIWTYISARQVMMVAVLLQWVRIVFNSFQSLALATLNFQTLLSPPLATYPSRRSLLNSDIALQGSPVPSGDLIQNSRVLLPSSRPDPQRIPSFHVCFVHTHGLSLYMCIYTTYIGLYTVAVRISGLQIRGHTELHDVVSSRFNVYKISLPFFRNTNVNVLAEY